jgi:hypothetical protein
MPFDSTMAALKYQHYGDRMTASILALIAHLLAPAPNRELAKDVVAQERLAGEFVEPAVGASRMGLTCRPRQGNRLRCLPVFYGPRQMRISRTGAELVRMWIL